MTKDKKKRIGLRLDNFDLNCLDFLRDNVVDPYSLNPYDYSRSDIMRVLIESAAYLLDQKLVDKIHNTPQKSQKDKFRAKRKKLTDHQIKLTADFKLLSVDQLINFLIAKRKIDALKEQKANLQTDIDKLKEKKERLS